MATELPPAVAKIIADVTQYTEPLQRAIEATREFGDRNDAAALQARKMGLDAAEAADRAAAAMKIAEDAAAKYERGEIDLAAAQDAATKAANRQVDADLKLAAVQEAVSRANRDNVSSQNELKKATEEASSGGFAEASMFSKIWTIAGFATSSLEPLAAGLIAVTGGLASGLTSAALGLGAFGAVAASAVTQVENANTAGTTLTGGLGQMQKQLKSVTSEWDSFVSKNVNGVSSIMSQGMGLLPSLLQTLQKFIAPAEQGVSQLVKLLGTDIKSSGFSQVMNTLAKNSAGSIEKLGKAIFNIVGGFGHLMADFAPFAQVVLSGLDSITAAFDKWAAKLPKTKGFAEFMQMVKANGPTIVNELKNIVEIAAKFISDMAGSDSNFVWIRFLPGLLQFANAFMKTHTALVENIMNLMMYKAIAQQAFGAVSKGVSTISNFAEATGKAYTATSTFIKGFKAVDAATAETIEGSAKLGFTMKQMITGVPFKNFIGGFKSSEVAADEASGIMGTFGGKVAQVVASIKSWTIWSKISAAATKVWTGIQAAFNAVMDMNPIVLVTVAIVALIAVLVLCYIHFKSVRDIVNDVGRAIRSGFLVALHAIEDAAKTTIGWISANWPRIINIFTAPVKLVATTLRQYWDDISSFFSKIITEILGFVKSHWKLLLSIIGGPIVAVTLLIVTYWKQIKNAFTTGVDDVIKLVQNMGHDIVNFFKDAGSWLVNAGKDLVLGLINGVKSMVDDAINTVKGIGSDLLGAAKDVLGIFSPSREFTSIGAQITAGLVLGINSTKQQAVNASRQMSQEMLAAASSGQATAARAAGQLATAAMTGASLNHTMTATSTAQPIVINLSSNVSGRINERELWTAMQQQTFRYNIRNTGTVTGSVKPGG